MSDSDLHALALAVADCAQFSSLIRRALGKQQYEKTESTLCRDMSDLVGLVEWSLPLDMAQQSELNKARAYLAMRRLDWALTCVDGVLQSVRTAIQDDCLPDSS